MGFTIDTSDVQRAVREISDKKNLRETIREIATEIAKICRREVYNRTPKKTGQLAMGWFDRHGLRFYETNDGYMLELINPVEYALAVNDGHYSHNQYNAGGVPYRVDPTHRTVQYYAGNQAETFVFGHFFVEKTVIALQGDDRLTDIIYSKLREWFEECVYG